MNRQLLGAFFESPLEFGIKAKGVGVLIFVGMLATALTNAQQPCVK